MRRTLVWPDSARVTLRPAAPDDADALTALSRALAEDGRGMVLSVDQVDPAAERRLMLERELERPPGTGLHLVADHERHGVVAEATCDRFAMALCRHVGVITLGVHPLTQGRGLGRALMESLVAWGDAEGLLRLELYVRSDNDRARALYRSVGFTDESLRSRFVRLPDGRFIDDVVMVRATEEADGAR